MSSVWFRTSPVILHRDNVEEYIRIHGFTEHQPTQIIFTPTLVRLEFDITPRWISAMDDREHHVTDEQIARAEISFSPEEYD